MIDEGTIDSTPSFISMHNRIHIDEKWFYMSKTSQKYYLHPEEKEPFRSCKSKRFIAKIMFLAVIVFTSKLEQYSILSLNSFLYRSILIWFPSSLVAVEFLI